MTVTDPGVYAMPDAEYFAHPALSQSQAKVLLACPARYRWQLDHPRPDTKAFDFGHAAHSMVLGTGPAIAVIPDDVLASNGAVSTKAAKEFIADARAKGEVPLKAEENAQVVAMADAIRDNPDAVRLLAAGTPEQAIVWDDGDVQRRCKLDVLPEPSQHRMVAADYKTTERADKESFTRSVINYGYHQQAAWYLEALAAVGISSDAGFAFVVQEKTEPYPVVVYELDEDLLAIGAELNAQAVELFRQCRDTDTWPGYPEGITVLSAPGWYLRRHQSVETVGAEW